MSGSKKKKGKVFFEIFTNLTGHEQWTAAGSSQASSHKEYCDLTTQFSGNASGHSMNPFRALENWLASNEGPNLRTRPLAL